MLVFSCYERHGSTCHTACVFRLSVGTLLASMPPCGWDPIDEPTMKLSLRAYEREDDYWCIRAFLREVFGLNDRVEWAWQVARLDYWRWHVILNCEACDPVERVTFGRCPTGRSPRSARCGTTTRRS